MNRLSKLFCFTITNKTKYNVHNILGLRMSIIIRIYNKGYILACVLK